MNKKPVVYGIVAVGPNNIIGHNGQLPWHSKQDLHFFKQMTMGHPCIFGKNTYENLPVKPLPGRLNIVCSSSYKIEKDGDVLRVPSLEEAIKQCGNADQVFVCGGASIYKYALEHDLIDIMYLTRIRFMDESLKKQIMSDEKLNTYFPYKFDCRGWKLEYTIECSKEPSSLLESPNVRAYFFKYTRIR